MKKLKRNNVERAGVLVMLVAVFLIFTLAQADTERRVGDMRPKRGTVAVSDSLSSSLK